MLSELGVDLDGDLQYLVKHEDSFQCIIMNLKAAPSDAAHECKAAYEDTIRK